MSRRIVFIGGGNMARAMIGALAQQPGDIHVVQHTPEKARQLQADFHDAPGQVTTAVALPDTLDGVDALVFAVKPQVLRSVAQAWGPLLRAQPHLPVISVVAGIPLASLGEWLGGHACLIRAMPNTPALVRQGACGLYAAPSVPQGARDLAHAILAATGLTVWVAHEALIDAVIAVSGSGPAYVFYFMEAMAAMGTRLGLPPEAARALTLQTFAGAAALAAQDNETLAGLRERVTSKGGTTFSALEAMRTAGVGEGIEKGMQAAVERAQSLSAELAENPAR